MRLCDLNVAAVVKPVMHYSERTMNKPVRHNYEMLPIPCSFADGESVKGCVQLFKGIDKVDSYGCKGYSIYVFYPGVKYGLVLLNTISDAPEYNRYHTVEEIVERVKGARYDSLEALLGRLDKTAEAGDFIGLLEIEFVKQFDTERAERYAQARLAYKERKEAQYAQQREQREAEYAAYVKEKNDEAESVIQVAIDTIKSGNGKIGNDGIEIFKSRYQSTVYSLVNVLCRRYNVNVPLRTQGWIAEKLLSFSVENGKYSGATWQPKKRGERPSQSIHKCLRELIIAVCAENTEA